MGYQAGAKAKGKPQGALGWQRSTGSLQKELNMQFQSGNVLQSEEGDGRKRALGGLST